MTKRLLSLIVIICFFMTTMGPIGSVFCFAQSGVILPLPGTMVNLSQAYEPALIKGITVHQDNPFLFDFILDTGNDKSLGYQQQEQIKKEGERLVKYFFASLTIPEKDLWVTY